MADLKKLSEEEILKALRGNEKILHVPELDIKNQGMVDALSSFDEVVGREGKLSRALARGISESKGFTGKTKIPDMVKELSSDLGIDAPDLEFEYKKGLAGWAHNDGTRIGLNPEHMAETGREAVIAHELRHIKELREGTAPNHDKSIRNIIYGGSDSDDILTSLRRHIDYPEAEMKMKGKALNFFNKKDERLFIENKLKEGVDALDIYDFLEKGHFDKKFLTENLKRVAKKLPIIGGVAALMSGEDASASVPVLDSATNLDYDKGYEDPSSVEYQKKKASERLIQALEKRRRK